MAGDSLQESIFNLTKDVPRRHLLQFLQLSPHHEEELRHGHSSYVLSGLQVLQRNVRRYLLSLPQLRNKIIYYFICFALEQWFFKNPVCRPQASVLDT